MHGRRDERRERRRNERRALRAHTEFGAEDRLRSRGSETDDDARLDDIDFRLEPRPARSDLRGVWFLVDALFSSWLPLEVLHHIGHVDRRAIDARLIEGAIEQAARRPDEWPALQVFGIARLFADKHHRRGLLPFAEDRLCACLPEVAGLAAGGDNLQLLEGRP